MTARAAFYLARSDTNCRNLAVQLAASRRTEDLSAEAGRLPEGRPRRDQNVCPAAGSVQMDLTGLDPADLKVKCLQPQP